MEVKAQLIEQLSSHLIQRAKPLPLLLPLLSTVVHECYVYSGKFYSWVPGISWNRRHRTYQRYSRV